MPTLDLNKRGSRYFIGEKHPESNVLKEFLFSDLMACIVRPLVGETVYLFLEQFVVKGAEGGMRFGWHQDSGYVDYTVDHAHTPYLSCWIPLDDVDEENGTVYVLPFSRAGGNEVRKHVREEGTNDLIGYHGDDPGVPAIVPAGGMVLFSSVTFHRSSPNTTNRVRRVYLAQYSPNVVLNKDGTKPLFFATPFLVNGSKAPRG